MASSSSSSSSSSSPCAACKFLRRKCTQGCVFAPYFPPDQPTKFANVHRVFGASNVAKLLNELHAAHREDAVNSLAYEAEARLRDPVYGCVGYISLLQQKLKQLQLDLYNARKELSAYLGSPVAPPAFPYHHRHHQGYGLPVAPPPQQFFPAADAVQANVGGVGGHTMIPHTPHVLLQQQQEHLQQQLQAHLQQQQQQEFAVLGGGYDVVGSDGGIEMAAVPRGTDDTNNIQLHLVHSDEPPPKGEDSEAVREGSFEHGRTGGGGCGGSAPYGSSSS